MARLLLLRHAQSEWNALGRWQGWGDPPLSAAGVAQSEKAAEGLHGFAGPVVSSDLLRASQTAEILAARLGLGRVSPEPGLREVDVGNWSGLTRDEIEAAYPGQLAAWRDGSLPGAEGGELRTAFTARVVDAVDRLGTRYEGDVLVVTHSGVIHALERHLGVYEGRRVDNLGGRWFEAESPLVSAGTRVDLLG